MVSLATHSAMDAFLAELGDEIQDVDEGEHVDS